MKYFFSLLYFCCLFVFASCKHEQLPYYNTPDFTPVFGVPKTLHHIGSFSFTNQNKKTITDNDINEKIHVASFFFTSCGAICPVITKNLQTVVKKYSNSSKIVFLSYSVTPWIDNAAKLKSFALKNQINEINWHLLTGPKSEIYNLARKSYFAEEELGFTKDSTDFLHTEHILLVDKNKNIRGIYNGTLLFDMEQLSNDIQTLLNE